MRFPEKPLQVKWKITQIHLHFSHCQLSIWRCSDSPNEPFMSALPSGEIHSHPMEQRRIFLMLNGPVRQEPASPQSLSQGIDIGSVLVLHPLLYSSDSLVSFSPLLLSHVTLQQQHPPRSSPCLSRWRCGCLLRQANSAEAAFSWTKPMDHDSSVSPFCLQGNQSIVAWI